MHETNFKFLNNLKEAAKSVDFVSRAILKALVQGYWTAVNHFSKNAFFMRHSLVLYFADSRL